MFWTLSDILGVNYFCEKLKCLPGFRIRLWIALLSHENLFLVITVSFFSYESFFLISPGIWCNEFASSFTFTLKVKVKIFAALFQIPYQVSQLQWRYNSFLKDKVVVESSQLIPSQTGTCMRVCYWANLIAGAWNFTKWKWLLFGGRF